MVKDAVLPSPVSPYQVRGFLLENCRPGSPSACSLGCQHSLLQLLVVISWCTSLIPWLLSHRVAFDSYLFNSGVHSEVFRRMETNHLTSASLTDFFAWTPSIWRPWSLARALFAEGTFLFPKTWEMHTSHFPIHSLSRRYQLFVFEAVFQFWALWLCVLPLRPLLGFLHQ